MVPRWWFPSLVILWFFPQRHKVRHEVTTDDGDGDDSADSLTCNSVQPFWNWITNLLVKLWSTQATQMCHQRDIYSGVVSISAQLSRGQYPGQKHVMWTWCAVVLCQCQYGSYTHTNGNMSVVCRNVHYQHFILMTDWTKPKSPALCLVYSECSLSRGRWNFLTGKQRRQCTNSTCDLAE